MDLHQAARRLGVHYQTAYRWVRNGSLVAVKRGATYEIDPAEVERLRAAREAPAPPPSVVGVRDWPQQAARLYAALAAGDELGARTVVDRLTGGGTGPLELVAELFTPVMRRIGEGWAGGTVSVAEEHRATAICERLLARVAQHPRGHPRGVVVVATTPTEDHGLPATMAAAALRADGWQVHHLGAGVPTAELVVFAPAVGADILVITVTNPAALPEAAEITSGLASSSVRVLVGGPGRSVRELLAAARAR